MEKFLFNDWLHKIDNFEDEVWITVYSEYKTEEETFVFYSALIDENMEEEMLNSYSWGLRYGDLKPCFVESSDHEPKYFRFGTEHLIEPIVIERFYNGLFPSHYELSEEFRLYYNLYFNPKERIYVSIKENSDEDIVVYFNTNDIKIKASYLKQFLAIKKMSIIILYDIFRFSPFSLVDLGLKNKDDIDFKNGTSTYNVSFKDSSHFSSPLQKSNSRLLGKKIIKGLTSFKPTLWNDKYDKMQYVEFIIGIDNYGEEKIHTCNPHDIDATSSFTPVFFSREVLKKYFSDHRKYSVSDGQIDCKGSWSLRVDNHHKNYVIVYLKDLGTDIQYKEQLYWKSFNIPPEGKLSSVKFERDFLGEFTDAEFSEFRFKDDFLEFQEKWQKKIGFFLFKTLKEGDMHHFDTLHVPLKNVQAEFDELVLSLTKILVDSINEEDIKKHIIDLDKELKGIGILNKYFIEQNFVEAEKHITFLSNIQNLRSSGSAHRKGKNYVTASKKFQLNEKSFIDVFDEILLMAIEMIKDLDNRFLK